MSEFKHTTLSLNLKKHKNGAGGLRKHIERIRGWVHSNEKIDDERTGKNIIIVGGDGRTYDERIQAILDKGYKGKKTVRKDAVKMVTATVQFGADLIENGTEEEQLAGLFEAYNSLAERFGQENIISAVIHRDETNPHLHFAFVPLSPDGQLSAKRIMKDKGTMHKLQNEFLEDMRKRCPEYNFERKKDNEFNGLDQKLFERMTEAIIKLREAFEKEKEMTEQMFAMREQQLASKEAELARGLAELAEKRESLLVDFTEKEKSLLLDFTIKKDGLKLREERLDKREQDVTAREQAATAKESALNGKMNEVMNAFEIVKRQNEAIKQERESLDDEKGQFEAYENRASEDLKAKAEGLDVREANIRVIEANMGQREANVARRETEASEKLSEGHRLLIQADAKQKQVEQTLEEVKSRESKIATMLNELKDLKDNVVTKVSGAVQSWMRRVRRADREDLTQAYIRETSDLNEHIKELGVDDFISGVEGLTETYDNNMNNEFNR